LFGYVPEPGECKASKGVDGQFYRSGTSKVLRTNPIEAKAEVAEVRRRFAGVLIRRPWEW
jgi:hypothetical protein